MKNNSLKIENYSRKMAQEILKIISKEEIEKIAREVGFVQREGKIKPWQFLYLCAFSELDISKDTLVEMTSKLGAKTNIDVSSQAIDQRFNDKAVNFLKTLFTKLLKNNILEDSNIECLYDSDFERIRITDSTAFQVPEAYKDEFPGSGGSAKIAGVKIQLEYELKTGDFMHIDVEPARGSDNTFGSKINNTFKPKDLSLRDLGYFNFNDFKDIESKGAFYISRLKPNVAVYLKNEDVVYYKNGNPRKTTLFKKANLIDIADKMSEGEILEIDEAFVGRTEKRKERLLIYKLTNEQLKKRKEKSEYTAKRKGIKKSKLTIALLGITVYITNIGPNTLQKNQVHEFYSLRWQVEIIFKIWKSIFHLSKIKPVKIERFKCQLYGKLILMILSSMIIFKMRSEILQNKDFETSEIKSAEIVSQYIQELYLGFINKPLDMNITMIVQIYNCICKNGRKSHRKGKKTFFDILGVPYNCPRKRSDAAA
jgi:hypothetical protein